MIDKIKKIIQNNLLLIVIILLSLPAARYLFVYGYFGVSDDLHVGWLYEMHRVVEMLQFPPRFVPDLSYGFGYPLFSFVYPLPFYLAEIFNLVGFSLVNSIKLVFGLSIPLSMYFMYKFLRRFVAKELSLAGAVLYVYAPYRALEIFVRGTIGEITAFVIFPIIIYSYIKLTDVKKYNKWVGIAGLTTAALVLSHNIMAYMFMPFLLVLITARIFLIVKNKKEAIKKTLIALLLGLLTSIYFWFPAILESKLMKYDTIFNFYDHFPTLRQFITPYFGYGASVPGPYDTMSFYMGAIGLMVVFLGLFTFTLKFKRFSEEERVIIAWGSFVFFTSIFMMNYRSAFLWVSLPLLPYFQFPWRFLAMTTLVSPLFLIAFSKFKFTKLFSLIIIFLAIGLNFNYFKTSEYLGRGDDYYLNRFIPIGTASDAYKLTSEEYLRLPRGSDKRPDKIYPRAYSDSGAELVIDKKNDLDATIYTISDVDFELNYNKYYYPGWSAKIDGKPAEVFAGKPFGQIVVNVPRGKHEVEVAYTESTERFVFDIISLISLATCIVVIKNEKNNI